MLIEFVKEFGKRKAGDVMDLWHHSASLLIKEGIAKSADVKESPKKRGRKPKEDKE